MTKSIYPCLWFDGNAAAAAQFYVNLFQDGQMLEDTPMVVHFSIMGTRFMGLNGGPSHKMTKAVSYFVYCGGDDAEIDRLYTALSQDGEIVWPLSEYPWSRRYAWVQDRFGVNWQLDVDPINSTQRIVPCLLFTNEKMGQVEAARSQYVSLFPKGQVLMEMPYPPDAGLPEGTLLFTQFKLDGYIMNAMSSTLSHDFDFTPGNSFVISCDTQAEIDAYWEALGAGGRFGQCGWLEDQFGVSWQIVPHVLSQLMADPDKAPRVVEAFLKMQKFDIQGLMEA